jgi:hypothetical protein
MDSNYRSLARGRRALTRSKAVSTYCLERYRRFADSPLEEDGFEPSVPGTKEPIFVAEGELRDRTGAAKKGCFLCGTDGSNEFLASRFDGRPAIGDRTRFGAVELIGRGTRSRRSASSSIPLPSTRGGPGSGFSIGGSDEPAFGGKKTVNFA